MAAAIGYPEGDKWGNIFLPYLTEFFFEKEDYVVVDPADFYLPDERVLPDTIALVKRFLKQVRESRGYDVDCYPPGKLNSPFMPIQLDKVKSDSEPFAKQFYSIVASAAQCAIDKINADTGRDYKLVEIEKAVHTRCFVMFLTFKVVELDDFQVLQSAVSVPCGADPSVEEWRFKPSEATTSIGW